MTCLLLSFIDSTRLLILLSCAGLLVSCGDPGKRPWQAHAISLSTEGMHEILTMELADLDHDGRDEILASRVGSEFIYLYSSTLSADGAVLWTEHRIQAIAGIQRLHRWKAGTRDAPEYFLVASTGAASGEVLLAQIPEGDAIYQPDAWQFSALPIPAGDWTALHSNDFNNDGISDLALAGRAGEANQSSAPEIIWMSDSQTGERVVVTIGQSAAPLLLYGEDVEGDGDIDLLVVDSAAGANSMGAYWLENPWPENAAVLWKRNFITLSALQPIAANVVDFDSDRASDLLLCLQEGSQTNRLMCFKKVAAATNVAWLPLPLPISGKQGSMAHAELADVDRDGFNDLILGYTSAASPMEHLIWLRNPSPAATSPAWIRKALSGKPGSSTAKVLLSDVDADGDLDVISADDGGALRWYANTIPAATTKPTSE